MQKGNFRIRNLKPTTCEIFFGKKKNSSHPTTCRTPAPAAHRRHLPSLSSRTVARCYHPPTHPLACCRPSFVAATGSGRRTAVAAARLPVDAPTHPPSCSFRHCACCHPPHRPRPRLRAADPSSPTLRSAVTVARPTTACPSSVAAATGRAGAKPTVGCRERERGEEEVIERGLRSGGEGRG